MKKTIILSVAITFASFGAFAQQAASPAAPGSQMQAKPHASVEERAKSQADKINSMANLSPDQYSKVLEVIKNSITQRDAIRASSTPGEDTKVKLKALREQGEAQMKTILTPEQFEKVQAERKASQAEGHKPTE